jgi:AcrR family transcriptional regulator
MALSTRARLVNAARRLFAEKGYGSTSVADILKAADVHSGSLYHVFPTKQALLEAVLDEYLGGIGPMLLEPAWAGVDDPVERVFALLASYRRFLVETDFFFGCPIGSIALELHEPDPPVRKKLEANFTAWKDAVAACLADAESRLTGDVDTRRLASFVLTAMEGAVMQARTYRSVEAFDESVACLRDYFERLQIPETKGRASHERLGGRRPQARSGVRKEKQ